MNIKENLTTAILITVLTTVLFGLVYPLAVTGLAQVIFPDRANGSLIKRDDGVVIGSRLIGQPFTSPGYFRSRPSAAGPGGYDAGASAASNVGPTSMRLMDQVQERIIKLRAENPEGANQQIPVDLVTASASGLDPHISPAAAEFQIPRVARERALGEDEVRGLVHANTTRRWFGFLGEPGVNVLQLNLALDERKPMPE